MANGDIAASVGYGVVAGSDDIRNGYDQINLTRDYLAQHRLTGTHPMSRITGLANALDDIREKRYLIRFGNGASDVLTGDGALGSPATFTTDSFRGSWSGPGGLATWQFSPTTTAVYTVSATAAWRTTQPGQFGTVFFDLRTGMPAGGGGSAGTAVLRHSTALTGGEHPAHTSHYSQSIRLTAGTIYSVIFENGTSDAIMRESDAVYTRYSVMYETPVGTVP